VVEPPLEPIQQQARSSNMRPVPLSVHITTLVLLINMIIGLVGGPAWMIGTLFLTGPLLVLWMVWQVLHDDTLPMRDLENGENWGYQDRRGLRPTKE
jgi:hypothetical protein